MGLAVTVPLAVAVYDLLTFSTLPVSNKVTLVSAMGMAAFLFSMVGGVVECNEHEHAYQLSLGYQE